MNTNKKEYADNSTVPVSINWQIYQPTTRITISGTETAGCQLFGLVHWHNWLRNKKVVEISYFKK